MRGGLASGSLLMQELELPRFAKTWEVLREGVAQGVAPGMVAGVWDARAPERIRVASVGRRRRFPDSLPALEMRPETIFDLASVSKIMGAATLAARLVDRRWISWDTPLTAILPQAARSHGVTIAHLLSHTGGYIAWEPLWERMRGKFGDAQLPLTPVEDRQRAMRELVFSIAPEVAPGARAVYSDISFLLLGFALEEVTGKTLDAAVREWVWKPLGLETAYYQHVLSEPARARIDEVAATEICPWRGGLIQGQVHDDNCWTMGGYGGHAGAFGSVRDVLQFARALFPGEGSALSFATLKAAWSRAARPADCSRTLGWDTPSGEQSSAGRHFARSSVGHLGFTGTSLWIDHEAGLAVTLLTNRVHPSRENNLIRAFRPRFHNALREDLRLG